MKKIKIYIKKQNSLIHGLKRDYAIEFLKKPSFLGKLIGKSINPDICFHNGVLNNDMIDIIKNSKKIIVPSFGSQKEILSQLQLDVNQIEVIYPIVDIEEIDKKAVKKELFEELDIPKKRKIILFTAKNFKSNGIKEFMDIIASLTSDNFTAIVYGNERQINNLKFQIEKYQFGDKVKLLSSSVVSSLSSVFSIADIFILPTHTKLFATNILRAMSYKTAVFVTSNNDSREVVDVFATMSSPNDQTVPFKIDALLQRNDDLKLIKKQNYKIAKKFGSKAGIEKIVKIIDSL